MVTPTSSLRHHVSEAKSASEARGGGKDSQSPGRPPLTATSAWRAEEVTKPAATLKHGQKKNPR